MRRFVYGLVGLLLLLPVGLMPAVASAQGATPVGQDLVAGLGLPTLDITVTANGYEGIPGTLDAGRYLVTLTATDDTAANDGGAVGFVQPAGMSGQDFVDFLGQMSGSSDTNGAGSVATPMEEMAATPADGGGADQGAPEFFYQSKLAGGVSAAPGRSAQVVIDLTPGEWVAWADDPTAPQTPVVFEATGEMPADLPEPDATATITLSEYNIAVSEGQLTTGPQVIRVDNVGAQPHFIAALSAPEGITGADVEAILNADMTGTPAAISYDPEKDFQPAFATGTQSTGVTTWIVANIAAAGPVVMLCFFPDQGDGMPHALHGMYAIVDVS